MGKAEFPIKIGISGVPSTGKTLLSRAVSAALTEMGFRVGQVQEYARYYIGKYGDLDSIQEQAHILQKQKTWEDEAALHADIVVTDSPIFLGFLYCAELAEPDRQKDALWFGDIFKHMLDFNTPPRYTAIFHLPPVLPAHNDGVRREIHSDEAWRKNNDMLLRALYQIFKPKYWHELSSISMKDRVQDCLTFLRKHGIIVTDG